MKLIIGYFLALLTTYTLGAIFVSQGNIAAVTQLGYEVSIGQRLYAMGHDVSNMHDLYLPLVAAALAVALPVAFGISYFRPALRRVGYVAAGCAGMIALHLIMKAVVDISGVAPTRVMAGLLLQGLAGAVGGLVFYAVNYQLFPPPKQA
ncbi:MAG: hypothetical protein ACR2PJ_03725 [Pseudomonadales bacterium]